MGQIPIFLKCFWRSSLIVPIAPISKPITVALMFYSPCTGSFNSSYFVIFSNFFEFMLWSPSTIMLMILRSPFSLSAIRMSGLLFSISASACLAKTYRILDFSSSSTGSVWWEYLFCLHSISSFLHKRNHFILPFSILIYWLSSFLSLLLSLLLFLLLLLLLFYYHFLFLSLFLLLHIMFLFTVISYYPMS